MSCSNCNSNGCNSGSICCGDTVQTVSEPPHDCLDLCPEDHTKYVCDEKYNVTIKPSNAWNVPDCGETAVLAVSELSQIHIGAYIWSATYGYFEVTAHNKTTGEITVQNNCNTGNAAAGTEVPACSSFIVSDPPAATTSGQSSIYPYVAVDFTAPNVGVPTLITVTNVNGLSVGKNVSIASGTYELSGIVDANTIEITNNGAGVTPGTVILAENGAGELQYPVVLIDANPCTNSDVTQGSLLVCNAGIQQPLAANYLGAVPVAVDIGSNLFESKLLEIPTRTCTSLDDCCFTIVPGTLVYNVSVADSSVFIVGDLVQLGSRNDRYTVTDIVDATTIELTRTENPVAVETIPAGTSVCLAGCCETLSQEIEDLQNSNFDNSVVFATQTGPDITDPSVIDTLDSVTTSLVVEREFDFANVSATKQMLGIVNTATVITGQADDALTQELRMNIVLQQSVNGGAFTQASSMNYYFNSKTDDARAWSLAIPYNQNVIIPANTPSYTLVVRSTLSWLGVVGSSYTTTSFAATRGTALGIAL